MDIEQILTEYKNRLISEILNYGDRDGYPFYQIKTLSEIAILNGVNIDSGDGSGTQPQSKQEFVPTQGQVQFTLLSTPSTPSMLQFFINGIKQSSQEYTVSQRLITWTGDFILDEQDLIEIIFY